MNKKTIVILPLIVAISVAAGIIIGNLLKSNSQPVFTTLGHTRPNKLVTILKLIEGGYVDTVNTSDLIEKAIPGILENLDPHTIYPCPEYAGGSGRNAGKLFWYRSTIFCSGRYSACD